MNDLTPDDTGAIALTVAAQVKDLGGFSVRRLLPSRQRSMVGPWVFFDHMGPATFALGPGINVRPHPHINLATVTYLFEGEILHRDSLGYVQPIRPGDINLMVAGSGIVHSERERPEVTKGPRRLHGLQLWLALPKADEEVAPSFHHYPAADMPTADVSGVAVRVMMGSAYGLTSPVRTFAKTLYVEAKLAAGQTLTLPAADERAFYVVSGAIKTAVATVEANTLAILSGGAGPTIEATEATRLAIIGGENIGPRFIEWNFVSTTRDRISRAKDDWRAGNFPTVPGDEHEFIPLPGTVG